MAPKQNDKDTQHHIAVLGCGYVGVTTAVILANCGYKVHAIEVNQERLAILKQGHSFFYETGINTLIEQAANNGNLTFTDSYDTALANTSIVFSCVGTPDNPDGSSNLSYVFSAAKQSALLLKSGAIFIQKSTVPVGTGSKIEDIFAQTNKTISYVSNPEFLRESTAVIDTLWPDRIVAGSSDTTAAEKVLNVYRSIENYRSNLAHLAGIKVPTSQRSTEYILTSRNSAELIKVSANAFLALKISFANSIAKLADKADADVTEVMHAVGADLRIQKAFLNAGRGYGGGCFPKDVSGLIRSAEEYGVEMEIMRAVEQVNESMPHYILNKALVALDTPIQDLNCTVLGLAFKSGTSDVRRSPAIAMANTLAGMGANVCVYDPQALNEAKNELHEAVTHHTDIKDALLGTDCIFIATDWPEFLNLEPELLSNVKAIVDCMNCVKKQQLPAWIKYIGVGRD